ncbi:hypothetical protein H0H93_015421, partial [Arthromyces matolae]
MCSSQDELDSHNQTRIHRNKVQGQSLILKCPLCNAFCRGQASWKAHIRSRKHTNVAIRQGLQPKAVVAEEAADVPQHTLCLTCSVHIHNKDWDRHLKTNKHLEKERFAAFRVVLDEAEKDKQGVSVDGEFDFGIISPGDTNDKVVRGAITVNNPTSRIALVDARLAADKGNSPIPSSFKLTMSAKNGQLLSSSSPMKFNVSLKQSYVGRCKDRLEFIFEDLQLRTRFFILRQLEAIIGNQADHEKLRPVAPYTPRPRATMRQPELVVVEGVRPPSMKAIPYVVPLPHAPIPS